MHGCFSFFFLMDCVIMHPVGVLVWGGAIWIYLYMGWNLIITPHAPRRRNETKGAHIQRLLCSELPQHWALCVHIAAWAGRRRNVKRHMGKLYPPTKIYMQMRMQRIASRTATPVSAPHFNALPLKIDACKQLTYIIYIRCISYLPFEGDMRQSQR